MGIRVYGAAAYARMLKALLPPGKIFDDLDSDKLVSKALLASGDELARVSGRTDDLFEESDPRTTNELLVDFESELDITAISGATVSERQGRIVSLLVRRQRVRPVDYQDALAGVLDLDSADVQVIEHSRAFAIAVSDDRTIYRFFVYRDPALPGTYDVTAAQEVLDEMAHSHTKGHVIESTNFLCDSPLSLCDRDILGA